MHVGALLFLERLMMLSRHRCSLHSRLRGVAGSSVGAFFALMYAIGVDAASALTHFIPLALAISQAPVQLASALQRSGLASLAALRLRLLDLLRARTGLWNPTLAELREHSRCELAVVVTDCRSGAPLVLRPGTHPDACAADCVVASMSLPLVFEPVRIEGMPDWYMDGGLALNFPFELFPPERTLGLWICRAKAAAASTERGERPGLHRVALGMQLAFLGAQEGFERRVLQPRYGSAMLPLYSDVAGFRLERLTPIHAASLCRRGTWLAAMHMLVHSAKVRDCVAALASIYSSVPERLLQAAQSEIAARATSYSPAVGVPSVVSSSCHTP